MPILPDIIETLDEPVLESEFDELVEIEDIGNDDGLE
jgi:hypothetical protein